MLDGGIQVLLDQTLDLAEAPQALQYLAAGHAKGKVILTPTTP